MAESGEFVAVRTAPGWWSNLVRAECDRCPWHGMTRNVNEPRGMALARMDARSHLVEHGEDR